MPKRPITHDVECYINYFEIGFYDILSGKYKIFEMFGDDEYLNTEELRSFVMKKSYTFYGFNSNGYDSVMIDAAIMGFNCSTLKQISDELIAEEQKAWNVRRSWGIKRNYYDHVDLIEVAIGKSSLKMYGARMHFEELEELPYPADKVLTRNEAGNVLKYNKKDLRVTARLREELKGDLEVRDEVSQQYGIDVRSKSDAQIAEAIFKHELEQLGIECKRPKIPTSTKLKYHIPEQFETAFKSEDMLKVLEDIRNADFELSDSGSVILPKILDRKIKISNRLYKMGIGGLHSEESGQSIIAKNSGYLLFEKDVASYYPNIILNQSLYPKHLGEAFIKVYKDIVDRRLYAKPRGKGKIPGLTEQQIKHYKQVDATLKIVINGSFGKFGNKWSIIYAPDFLIQVTITGQLGLLWLIELISEIDEANVVSANTDGIVVHCSEESYDEVNKVCKYWEEQNSLILEETRYQAIYSQSVNHYLAVKDDGKYKTKGVFSRPGLSKGAAGYISVQSVIDYLVDDIPIEDTIYLCDDIREFVHVRAVKGGGNWSVPKELPKLKAPEKREFLLSKGCKIAGKSKTGIPNLWDSYYGQEPHSNPVTTDKAYNAYKKHPDYQPDVIEELGKTVRWYYAEGTEDCSITYSGNGNTVATSLGSKPVMDLPGNLPEDIKYDKYIDDSVNLIESLGLTYERI